VVCSGLEAQKIGAKYGDKLKLLVPGIRPAGGSTDDQRRTVTAAEAAKAGANYIVLGRMITEAKEPASELRSVMKTI
jgi:orotidine-5'-phosphate decarboxylase